MNPKLLDVELRPGLILNMCQRTLFGWLVRLALGRAYGRLTGDPYPFRNCPSHSAMIVEYQGRLFVAEARFPFARLTPLSVYENNLTTGKTYNLKIFEVVGATPDDERAACQYWFKDAFGTPYDQIAMFRLALKALFGDWMPAAAGWTWAHWCTEANMEAWRDGAMRDPYRNNNPTPLTEYKRWREGYLECLNTVSGKP